MLKTISALVLLACFPAHAAGPSLLKSSAAVFDRPHDLVLSADGTLLYVADMNHNEIKVVDAATLTVVGAFGAQDLSRPHDLDFDPEGRLLVADTGNSRLVVYAVTGPRGVRVDAIGTGLNWPEGVAADRNGDIYATNVGAGNVVRLRGGRVEASGGSGTGRGEFIRPHDIAVGRDGRVYVADPGNNRIQVLDASLQPLAVLDLGFNEPKYFDLAADGLLYVADQHNNVIKVVDDRSALIATFGEGLLNLPEGVEVDGTRIWVSDTYNNRVVLFEWRR